MVSVGSDNTVHGSGKSGLGATVCDGKSKPKQQGNTSVDNFVETMPDVPKN